MAERIVDANDDRDVAVAVAAQALRDGHLAVLPTDTVYGVAADAFNTTGTRRIFGAKRRSRRFPLPVLVRRPKQLLGLCPAVPVTAESLMSAYWPGPLTIVVPVDPDLEWDIGDNRGTVAVRMPMDDLVLDVIRAVGPLAVTSANISGSPAATTATDALDQLGDLVEVYVDEGVRSDTSPSTIVDVSRGAPQVLREGPLPTDDVLAVARGELDPIEAANRLFEATASEDRAGDRPAHPQDAAEAEAHGEPEPDDAARSDAGEQDGAA